MILLIWFSSVRNLLRKCLRSTASPLCFKEVTPSIFLFTLAISKCYGKVRVLFFPRDNFLVSDRKSHSLNLWPWQLLAVGQLPALVATSGTWHRGQLGLFEVCQAEGRRFESRP